MAGGDTELCKVSRAKRKSKVVLATAVCRAKKKKNQTRLPADFNPILSSAVDLVRNGKKKWQQNFLLMLGFGQAATGHNSVPDFFCGMIAETVRELQHSRIQWVVVVVVFSDFGCFLFFFQELFFFVCLFVGCCFFFFFKHTLDSNEDIHTGLINRTGAPEASVFPNHKNGRTAELWIIPTGILIDLKTHQPESSF